MSRSLILSLLLLPLGCALRVPPADLATLPLPDSAQLPCCWQSEDALVIDYRNERHHLTSVMAVDRAGLTLIVFDPLGRKLLLVKQQGDEIKEKLFIESDALPIQWLLPAIFLAHMRHDRWLLQQSPWSVEMQSSDLVLYYRQRPTVVVKGHTDGRLPMHGQQRQLSFIGQGLTLSITTLVSKAL
ncbi:MAG: DUF3261 domain-containing protein [Pseudomonadales bacterium]